MSRGVAGRPTGKTLSRSTFVDAASQITQEAGLDEVSPTSLAEHLGVGRTTVYHHIGSLDSLLDDVCERVIAGVDLPENGPWRTWCEEFARRLRATLLAHPGVSRRIRDTGPRSPSQLAMIERVTGVVMVAGLDAREAALTYVALISAICESVEFIELRRRQGSTGAASREDWARLLEDPQTTPALHAVLSVFMTVTNEELFESAVGKVLDAAENRRMSSA